MSLRVRLVAALVALLLVVVSVVGFVVVELSRSVLVGQVDEQIDDLKDRFVAEKFSSVAFLKLDEKEVLAEKPPQPNSEAILIIDNGGKVLYSQQSGFPDNPDPVPDVGAISQLGKNLGVQTIASADGSMRYRAFGWESDSGERGLWAVPLTDVDAAVSGILRVVLLTGALVTIVGGAVTWLLVQHGLRPVDRMVETATTIASGDLTGRVQDTDPSTELGRLGRAINEMLAQIEDAFTNEQTANERLKQFVADASHELRTPIATINGYSELYRKGALVDQSELDNAMRRIATETSRMQRLVEDLLLLARLDREQPMARRSVNLAAVVRDAATDSRAIESEREVTVEGLDSVRVVGDEQLLTQVVTSLLANARQHTPKGTSIAVNLGQDNGRVTLDVIDNGPGIPETDIEKLFERFYRADYSRSRPTGGAGLGLAIVAAIAEAHGGMVEAANQEGHGARFTVTLPIGT